MSTRMRRLDSAIDLIGDHDLFLLDAFGVLVTQAGAMPGAGELLAALDGASVPYLVVTNDASRLPETGAARLRRLGLEVGDDQLLSSGMLLEPVFERRGLRGARCMVLGPADSEEYVRRAGGEVCPIDEDADYEAIVVCDDDGFDFLRAIDAAVTALFRLIDRGDPPALILPNPDIIYPRGDGKFGYTAGGVALLLEAALERRYPGAGLEFERLGKPHPPLFRAALDRHPDSQTPLMIGDSIETDIAGAAAVGIASALVAGVSRRPGSDATIEPTYAIDRVGRRATTTRVK
jgi:HAD superfamily hydrolase (TIGR01450 family)